MRIQTDAAERPGYSIPERLLVAHVLAQAVSDYDAGRSDAKTWFADREPRPFGLLWVCSMLGLEPEWVLNQMAKPPAIRSLRKPLSRSWAQKKRKRGRK
jgi:hypothetical protein